MLLGGSEVKSGVCPKNAACLTCFTHLVMKMILLSRAGKNDAGASMLQIGRMSRAMVLILLMLLVWTSMAGATAVSQTEDDPVQVQAKALLDRMSVEERVGQLFLVTFQGDQLALDSDIADLILTYRIGGVVLQANNDNITGYGSLEDTPFQVADLSNNLQRLAILGITTAVSETDTVVDENALPPTPEPNIPQTPIPLLIAINHEGDGYPHSAILNGLTEIPTNMAIGASWQPENARLVGEIVGQELSALGINMLFGPSLDVLENPAPFSLSDLGTRSFGGDPYWVGQMAQAYTQGVHEGSGNQIAVVPKHFPGYGSSDRPLHEEVPTVRKSLEQLKQVELAPFFPLTNDLVGHPTIADALLTTHIRYQGFQGNIRATTNPVSFDQQALTTLMAQTEFNSWRQGGGILVSDSLGVRAVERFYDDTEQTFPHRLVAKDAFLAGNDLLYLSNFALGESNNAQELANIKDTLEWFRERYTLDPAFRVQVDAAVLRILKLKLRLYDGNLASSNVLVDAEGVTAVVGNRNPDMFDIAQSAVTLISPSVAELAERMPQPPGSNDNIVIFTDVRDVTQCSSCPPQPLIGVNAIEDRILAVYGPKASGQVQPEQIQSYTFSELQIFLNAGNVPIILPTPTLTVTTPTDDSTNPENNETATPVPTLTPPPGYLVQESLRNVDWIIFGMLDNKANAAALSTFLAQRPDLIRNTQIVVFAFNAPYYLDTTEISQLTAYFGIYSKSTAFIDASVRALFQELPLNGRSPVDIDSISYDLFSQTQPDPEQVIELYVVDEAELLLPEGEAPLDTSVGDTLNLRTGIIRDRNGNPVPDGTLVRFIQLDRVQGLVNIIDELPTHNGVAQLAYVLAARTEAGQFKITAEAGEAVISLEVNISVGIAEGETQVSISTPVPQPTDIPTPNATATATETPPPSATPIPTVIPSAPVEPTEDEPALQITLPEFQMLFALFLGLFLTFGLAILINGRYQSNWSDQLGLILWSFVGALLVYNYFALNLPGTHALESLGSWAGLLTTMLGGVLGLAGFQIIKNMRRE
jgi:beta-N-acetylhexosaminidase